MKGDVANILKALWWLVGVGVAITYGYWTVRLFGAWCGWWAYETPPGVWTFLAFGMAAVATVEMRCKELKKLRGHDHAG